MQSTYEAAAGVTGDTFLQVERVHSEVTIESIVTTSFIIKC